MAEKPSVMFTDGGLWNTRKPQYSPATTKLLKCKRFNLKYVVLSYCII